MNAQLGDEIVSVPITVDMRKFARCVSTDARSAHIAVCVEQAVRELRQGVDEHQRTRGITLSGQALQKMGITCEEYVSKMGVGWAYEQVPGVNMYRFFYEVK